MSTQKTLTGLTTLLSVVVAVGGISVLRAAPPSQYDYLTRLPSTAQSQSGNDTVFADLSEGPEAHVLTGLSTDIDIPEPSDNTGCECLVPCCNMCPCTYGFVDGLLWDRNNRAGNRPLVQDVNSGAPLLTADQLNFNWAAGVRALVGKRITDCYALELGYLGIFNQQASASIVSPGQLQIPGDLGLAVNNFSFADQVDVNYSSYLHSPEINFVTCCCNCESPTCCRSREWIYGFRYLRLGEQANLLSTDPAEGTTNYAVRTTNDLYGVQIGHRIRHCYGKWSWEGTGKAGIYANNAHQSQDPIVDFPGFVFRPAQSSSTTSAAFMGELNLTGVYQLSSVWGIRAGYTLLWLEGVALAPDQFDFTNTPTSGSGINNDGGVFFHGVNIGMEARW